MTAFGFLSTYPPTRCGLATFTEALAAAIVAPADPAARIVRVDDLVPTGPSSRTAAAVVVGDLRPGSLSSRAAAAAQLDGCDAVIVQHEYGIFGGDDGVEVLDVLARISAPCIVVLHTVLRSPTAHQRWVLERVAGLAAAIVVMTRTARDLLVERYAVPAERVRMIPHGVAPWSFADAPPAHAARPTLLTWGLIGPGKGIEWGIRALAELDDLPVRPRYRVLGQTHPKVLLEAGEGYRNGLRALADSLGLGDDVELDDRYRDAEALAEAVASADLVLLPYDSRDQATSGVLAEAVSAGRPVIATAFPHAIELLSGGAGVIVDHADPRGIARAVRTVLDQPQVAARMAGIAREDSASTSWAAVATEYRSLASRLLAERVA